MNWLEEVSIIGDDHGDETTKLARDKSGQLFSVRNTKSSVAQYIIADFLQKLGELKRIRELGPLTPGHIACDEQNLLMREYIAGFTLGELQGYVDRCIEFLHLNRNVDGFEADTSEALNTLFESKIETDFELRHQLNDCLCLYKDSDGLRRALADHYEVPLDGEGFRPIVDGLSQLYQSNLRSSLGLPVSKADLARRLLTLFIGHSHNKGEVTRIIIQLIRRLGQIYAFVEALHLYDMHPGNLLLTTSSQFPTIMAFDFECVFGGTSQGLFPTTPSAFSWAARNFYQSSFPEFSETYRSEVLAVRSSRLFTCELEETRKELTRTQHIWKKRVVVAGTIDLEHIVKIHKESIFYSNMMSRSKEFLDLNKANFPDINSLENKWKCFQIWKRFYRGLARIPFRSTEHEGEAQRFAASIRAMPQAFRQTSELIEAGDELIVGCAQFDTSKPLIKAILDRLVEPMSNIPFDLFDPTPEAPDKQRASGRIWDLIEQLQVDSHMDENSSIWKQFGVQTLQALVRFEVPIFYLPGNHPFRVSKDKFNGAKLALKRLGETGAATQTSTAAMIDIAWGSNSTQTDRIL